MARPTVPSRRLLALLVVTALALMTIDARGFGPLQSVRRTMLAATQPVRNGMGWLASPVADGWRGAVHYGDLEAENAALRERVADLEGEIDQLPDSELRLQQLLDATGLEYVGDVPRVTGRVVADRRTGLERIIEIDRGSDDGVQEDMPVVTGAGLVGRVLMTTSDRCIVRLITDPRFSVGLVSVETGAIGVAAGGGDGQRLVLDIEDASLEQARDGLAFETSGFDRSRYPGGIPVGTLVVDEERDLRILEPFADLDHLGYLTVLLVPEPR